MRRKRVAAKWAARPDSFVVSSLVPRCTSMYYLGTRCGPSRSRPVRPILRCILALALLAPLAARADAPQWNAIVAKARGQVVNFNAWAGDEKINAFIEWTGAEVARRYGVTLRHVKLRDTAEAVTRVIAEKAAGRNADGTVDLI